MLSAPKVKKFIAVAGILLIASAAVLVPVEVEVNTGRSGVEIGFQKSTALAALYYDSCTNVQNLAGGTGTTYVLAKNQTSGDSPTNNACSSGENFGGSQTCSGVDSTGTQCNKPANSTYNGPTAVCSSFSTCVADLVYLVTVSPTSEFAYIGSLFLSVGVHLSLQSTAYALTFLQTGWTVARDVANMAFLFIIVYLALTIIVKADSSGTTHTLVLIIVMALLVNFSFFLTRVVVDFGNVAAVTVYNALPNMPTVDQIGTTGTTGTGSTAGQNACNGQTNFICGTGTKDLSSAIMSGLNVQNLYNTPQFQQWASANDSLTKILTLVTLYIALAIVLAFVGFIFLSVGAKFLVRIVALWLVIIASPIAFAAYALPQTRKWFSQWLWQLLKNSFYPAIFLFLFLFVVLFMQQGCTSSTTGTSACLGLLSNVFNNGTASTNGVQNGVNYAATLGLDIAAVAIVMGLVIILLYIAMKVSDRAAGAGAHLTTKFPGWAIGQSSRVASLVGRGTLGLAGAAAARSETLRDSGRIGNTLWRLGGRASNASFDVRASRLGGTVSRRIGAGQAVGQGGVEAAIERRNNRIVNRGKALLDTDEIKERRRQEFIRNFKNGNGGVAPDEAIAREKGVQAKNARELEIINAEAQQLETKQRAGTITDGEKIRLNNLGMERRQKLLSSQEAQTYINQITKAEHDHVEQADANRERVEQYIGKLGEKQQFIGNTESMGKLRKILPERQPIEPTAGVAEVPTSGGIPAAAAASRIAAAVGAGGAGTPAAAASAGTNSHLGARRSDIRGMKEAAAVREPAPVAAGTGVTGGSGAADSSRRAALSPDLTTDRRIDAALAKPIGAIADSGMTSAKALEDIRDMLKRTEEKLGAYTEDEKEFLAARIPIVEKGFPKAQELRFAKNAIHVDDIYKVDASAASRPNPPTRPDGAPNGADIHAASSVRTSLSARPANDNTPSITRPANDNNPDSTNPPQR